MVHAGEQRRALVGGRSGGAAGTAKRVQNPSFARRENLLVVSAVSSASRLQGRWSPPLESVEQTAMRCKPALPRGRSKCTHSHARGIVVNGAMTRTNTSGRSHHVTVEAVRDAAHGVPVEGHGHSPPIRSRTGARSQTRTGTHRHSRTWRLLPSWLPCPSCLHTQPAPSPLSGAEKDSTTATRIVAGSRRKESVRSRSSRFESSLHHAWVASSVRLSVNSLLMWMSLG